MESMKPAVAEIDCSRQLRRSGLWLESCLLASYHDEAGIGPDIVWLLSDTFTKSNAHNVSCFFTRCHARKLLRLFNFHPVTFTICLSFLHLAHFSFPDLLVGFILGFILSTFLDVVVSCDLNWKPVVVPHFTSHYVLLANRSGSLYRNVHKGLGGKWAV